MARMMRDRAARRQAEMEMDDVQASPFAAGDPLDPPVPADAADLLHAERAPFARPDDPARAA